MVVAGVMINGDRTYRALEGKLRQIVSEEIPAQDRDAFVFHATDVFHGSRYFNRERWPQVDRQRILQKLASIPSEFGLPIVFGAMSRADYDASSDQVGPNGELPFGKTIEDLTDIGLHATAFMVAEFAIERQMQMFPRDEVCMVICEDTDRVKAIIKQTQAFLRSGKNRQIPQFAELAELPFKKIVDTPHFASKCPSENSLSLWNHL
jgi:hypothetical protein